MLILFIFLQLPIYSQENKALAGADTTSLQSILQRGKASGRVRNLFMATDNASGLTDYYANGLGFGIGYESAPISNFHVGISGFFMYNLASSDLSTSDKATGAPNRYEIGLFDLQDVNSSYLMRLENLYLTEKLKQSGETIMKTPVILSWNTMTHADRSLHTKLLSENFFIPFLTG